MDQPRRAPRYFFSAPAEILVERSGAKIDARVNEISLYGCYLDASIPLSVKTAVLLKILGRADYFEADATVIYANSTAGMGLVFRNVEPRFRSVLQKWLLAAMPKKAERQD